ncbi:MAG TPA: AmmeMemoRadiSam system radical SAM enzyme [Candidatus Wujingus californicus]|uniref:AmmeMemoRadiSam system radical SAM enzyme n=2 Tax=Candidatus Wujingus californicus TaxID=3367618 RepID=UPI001E001191|nr:AmmeMemoRadiSam system radical SAM enzyme [Planctomycetota bacterium]MDO8131840.1 AmmeMemoRadiSam system radical SAM enzyme [Candidatus Brocadiales bacterium]
MKEAMFFEKLENEKVKCNLCRHHCIIANGKKGICRVRENHEGILYSLVYRKLISDNIDPIEKKPLYHFYPGTTSFSIATVGCNFRCLNCQNYEISQLPKDHEQIIGRDIAPEKIVEDALSYNCKSISYTYTEPTIFFEYAYEVAKIASSKSIKNVFVTNGYITRGALKEIKPYLHAANIDLKSFSNETYKKICGAKLEEVLDCIRSYKEMGIWIEITTLIIPEVNDSISELKQIANFICSVGPEIPWHVSRFYPRYRLIEKPPTPIELLSTARQIGIEAGLRYVYEGNVPGDGGENTYCYKCKKLLIKRYGYQILINNIVNRKCPACDTPIDGVGL